MANATTADLLQQQFPVEWDWLQQDGHVPPSGETAVAPLPAVGRALAGKALQEPNAAAAKLRAEFELLLQQDVPDGDRRWLDLYARACESRRAARLAKLLERQPRVVFVKRQNIRPSFFAYTEGQSDAQAERHFHPGSTLCLLSLEGNRTVSEDLLADPGGSIRDPAVSWDGKRVAFAWKKSLNNDDYHLYEMDLASRAVRQLTAGKGVADYEPAYLPDGRLVFSSTRCVQTVDCWWTEVSNLYTCEADGRRIRRLGFDQVHAVSPQVLDDGSILYTRWDYNDRGQIYPQPLFQMNADGTGQTGYYGNNSWFPTTIVHARGIPDTGKVLAILCGHHSAQTGKLAVIDPSRGREENQGVQLVSPVRETKAERIDSYGQQGELFCYPFPLDEKEWIVSHAPGGWRGGNHRGGEAKFALYWMDIDGRRELLLDDPRLPCLQPAVVAARPLPPPRASRIDWHKETAACYVRDVYHGPGLTGVERGSVRKLRVVALEYRAAGIGSNGNSGPAGGALVSTPIAIGNGAWDVKRVLGDATVQADGSAYFEVPARVPFYFQALDEKGRALQTMRSWTTLQPGELASCTGCHEDRNSAPPDALATPALALRGAPQKLQPFHGPPRGFSFTREIQPILDRHCTRCHNDREALLAMAEGNGPPPLDLAPEQRTRGPEKSFSLLGETIEDQAAKRAWSDSYLVLTRARRGKKDAFRGQPEGKLVHWISAQSPPTMLPPRSGGAIRSGLLDLLEQRHGNAVLSRAELEKIACWIDLLVPFSGDYVEGNAWNPKEHEKYRRFAEKRRLMDELDQATVRELRESSSR